MHSYLNIAAKLFRKTKPNAVEKFTIVWIVVFCLILTKVSFFVQFKQKCDQFLNFLKFMLKRFVFQISSSMRLEKVIKFDSPIIQWIRIAWLKLWWSTAIIESASSPKRRSPLAKNYFLITGRIGPLDLKSNLIIIVMEFSDTVRRNSCDS